MSSNLNAVIRHRHAVAQIRALPVIGVDSPAITGDPAGPGRAAEPVIASSTAPLPGPAGTSNVVALRPATPVTTAVDSRWNWPFG